MKKILIFGKYPTSDNIKDGMIQRIKAIDDELSGFRRIYITISLFCNINKKIVYIGSNIAVYKLNIFFHYFFIINLIKSVSACYFHSIYNYVYAWSFPLKKLPIRILDIHGSVPEEHEYMGKSKLNVYIYNLIEKNAARRCNIKIAVSGNMMEHFKRKYPKTRTDKYIIKPIIPKNSFVDNIDDSKICALRRNLGILESDIVILYSGNLQAWQNFDLMLAFIKSCHNPKYHYIILTGQKEDAINKIQEAGMKTDKVYIDSVLPSELCYFYAIANYGFLLRDDHILNNVACPTKLIEYLYYGMIPILKSKEVGDRKIYNYEYISYDDELIYNLASRKSFVNSEIAKSILSSSIIDISQFINA